jgi:hypothetical protein
MPTVGGSNFQDIQIPRNSEIDYAMPGFPFSHASQAGTYGIRKASKISFPPTVRTDAIGKDQTDAKMFNMDFELWQDDFTSLYRMFLLIQFGHQLRIKTAGGDWYNLVKNTGGFGTPNGSTLVGAEMTYECTPTELALKLKYTGKMHPKEYDWMCANTAAGVTGATGGTAVAALTQMLYNQGEYGIPGIDSILWGSDDAGELENPKLSINFKKQGDTLRSIPIVRMAQVQLEYDMLQSRYWDLQTNAAKRNSDFTTTVNLWSGMTAVFANSLSLVDTPTYGDDKAFVHVVQKGLIPFDTIGVTAANILWNAGTKTVTFNRVGYN